MTTLQNNILKAENLLKEIIENRDNKKAIAEYNIIAESINDKVTSDHQEEEAIADFQMWAEEQMCEEDLFDLGIFDPDGDL